MFSGSLISKRSSKKRNSPTHQNVNMVFLRVSRQNQIEKDNDYVLVSITEETSSSRSLKQYF